MAPLQIRDIRERVYGLTREQFAHALGVTAQAVYYWELGRFQPNEQIQVMLWRMRELAQTPEGLERVRQAILRTQDVRPAPPPRARAPHAETAIGAGILGFGIGLLLGALFGGSPDPPRPRL